MKTSLTEIPLQFYPDPKKKFILYTDASVKAVGGVHCQEYPDGEEIIEKLVL